MITTRARGLANLHAVTTTLVVGVFFWVYAELIMRYVPVVRLSREVNLLPYFLCVIGGMVLAARDVARLVGRSHWTLLGEATRVAAKTVGLMAALTFTMMFATQDRSISRLFLGTFLVWTWLIVALLNVWLPGALSRLVFQRGHRLPTVLVGRVAALGTLNAWLASKEALGFVPIGILSDDLPPPEGTMPVPRLGGVADLARILTERPVGQVMLLELPPTDAEARTLIEICREHGCRLLIRDNLGERYTHPLVPILEDGHHFYTLQEEPLEDPLNRLTKRAFDLAIALPMVCLVLPPLCAWVWWMQRRQAPGPLFHVRERRGWQGESFRMLKFRSMRVAPDDAVAEARQATREDDRIFPFGRFLRRRSLDEFPQFWNVLRGDMSIVGPRPYMPRLDEEFRQHTRGYRTRYFVKPGITGLAQSLGYRGEVLEREMLVRRVYWDLHYINHWSVWLDLQITVRTLLQILRPPQSAY
ncbi:exopolysaccharide biosynthesis polyprenyl glycosylphosphotransferase [Opitutus sp. ER46]|uniref:exopolysaccharide biosynthesis polyprenyl glycosylphosphotransferase n=1 Tax=Opitutus sp. ER46 TaxID=2161864 RepID=UPI000D316427|nr:exopolysaccharide biosynthesis polyprenyl glycosylphosphotransferase [Opitutus sp. ER46]PTX94356.1 polyprenyl glycosylphosphotransferase [Opitutus sp. ER46]